MFSRILYLAAWIGALWQLWQGWTVGCFQIGRLALVHCFAQQPIWFVFDLIVVILMIIGLPFLIFFPAKEQNDAAPP